MAKKNAAISKKRTVKILADIEKTLAEEKNSRELARQKQLDNLKELALKLHSEGVKSIHVNYSGEGDSGDIDYLHLVRAFGAYILTHEESELIKEITYQFLPSGFEIDDGGQGEVTFDIASCTIKVEHKQRYTEYTESCKEFHFDAVVNKKEDWWA